MPSHSQTGNIRALERQNAIYGHFDVCRCWSSPRCASAPCLFWCIRVPPAECFAFGPEETSRSLQTKCLHITALVLRSVLYGILRPEGKDLHMTGSRALRIRYSLCNGGSEVHTYGHSASCLMGLSIWKGNGCKRYVLWYCNSA